MINYFVIFLIFSFCQTKSDSSKLAESLSWNSFEIDHSTHSARIELTDSVSQELLQLGKPVSKDLISVLGDKNKGIAAHLILTKIWQSRKFTLEVDYVYEGDQVAKIRYTLNKVSWIWNTSNESFSVAEDDLNAITNYWLYTTKK